jgi:hypothetical protein
MKKSLVIPVTAMFLVVVVIGFMAFHNPDSAAVKKSRNTIIGTWQLDSYKWGSSSSSFTSLSPDRPHIKMITDSRFLWVTVDAGTKKILESAGGTYTLDGENYIESIDYGYNMDNYLGSKSNFKIKVEDGMFYLTGVLSDGYKVEEIWQKIK